MMRSTVIAAFALVFFTAAAAAQTTPLQGSAIYNETLIPPGSSYPGPFYIWSDGSHHTKPQPRTVTRSPPSKPSPPSQTIHGNAETNDPGGYKVGAERVANGDIKVWIGNSHPNGFTVTHVLLVPAGYWHYISWDRAAQLFRPRTGRLRDHGALQPAEQHQPHDLLYSPLSAEVGPATCRFYC